MKIGIFGGSFNPVHLGHYEIVRQALAHKLVNRVIVVPAFHNPLKQPGMLMPERQRLKMIEKTFLTLPDVSISHFELNQQQTSYTYKTLEHFSRLYPNDQLSLILGEDSFRLFDQWASTDVVRRLANLIIFARPSHTDDQKPALPIGDKPQNRYVDIVIPAISSTEIRQRLQAGKDCTDYIHPDALEDWNDFRNKGRGPLHKKKKSR